MLEAAVAQLVEQPIRNRQVDGSSPPRGSILLVLTFHFSSRARTLAHAIEFRPRAALLFLADDDESSFAARENFSGGVADLAAMKEVAALARNF